MDHSPLDDLEDYGVSEAAPESDVTAVASPVMSRPGGDPSRALGWAAATESGASSRGQAGAGLL